MTDAEKAAILDWLLRPQGNRPDRALKIERGQSKNGNQMLWMFRCWGTKEEFLKTVQEQMIGQVLHS